MPVRDHATRASSWPFAFSAVLLAGLLSLWPASRVAASNSILIWPIDPVIEHDERATALWLENRGKTPAQMQLRIFGWRQVDGENVYDTQTDVVGSPPMIRIEPGQKQLVRLTRSVDAASGTERAYRVIVDDIPMPDAKPDDAKASVGIKFQMRYSIPLFVSGKGIWTKQRHDRERDPTTASQPILSWHVVNRDGKPFVEIRNTGPVHARLTDTAFRQSGKTIDVAKGLLGYVLAGSTARWPLPAGVGAGGELVAKVDGREQQPIAAMTSASP